MKKLLLIFPVLLMLGGCANGGYADKDHPADIYLYTASGNLINHWEAVDVQHSSNGDILYFEEVDGTQHNICGTFTVKYSKH